MSYSKNYKVITLPCIKGQFLKGISNTLSPSYLHDMFFYYRKDLEGVKNTILKKDFYSVKQVEYEMLKPVFRDCVEYYGNKDSVSDIKRDHVLAFADIFIHNSPMTSRPNFDFVEITLNNLIRVFMVGYAADIHYYEMTAAYQAKMVRRVVVKLDNNEIQFFMNY